MIAGMSVRSPTQNADMLDKEGRFHLGNCGCCVQPTLSEHPQRLDLDAPFGSMRQRVKQRTREPSRRTISR
jgi:rRNA maturation protein Nop10